VIPRWRGGHRADLSGTAEYRGKAKTPPKQWHAARTQPAIGFGKRFLIETRMIVNGLHKDFFIAPANKY